MNKKRLGHHPKIIIKLLYAKQNIITTGNYLINKNNLHCITTPFYRILNLMLAPAFKRHGRSVPGPIITNYKLTLNIKATRHWYAYVWLRFERRKTNWNTNLYNSKIVKLCIDYPSLSQRFVVLYLTIEILFLRLNSVQSHLIDSQYGHY